ncbi:MAG: hypothetical protein V7K40_27960 [Nostoc sp.]
MGNNLTRYWFTVVYGKLLTNNFPLPNKPFQGGCRVGSSDEVNEIVCVSTPSPFYSVGLW